MHKNQIKYGSIISYATIGINILLGLIYTPWILHEVGSSNYGLYTLASSLIALFLMDFGMGAAVTRFVSNYRARNDQESINSFVGLAVKFYVGICAVIAIILTAVFFNLELIYGNLSIEELSTFRIVFIITAFFVVVCFPGNVFSGILNAYEQYISVKLADVFNKIVTVIVTIIVLIFHGGIYELVFINGFFNLVTMVVKCLLVNQKTPVRADYKSKHKGALKDIFSFSAWTTVQTLSNQMIFNLIPTVLAMVTDTFAISLYGFANVIEGYVFNITQAINGLFLPSVSRTVVNERDAEKTLPLMIRVGRLNQSVISLLLIGLTVLGREFVHLWVGDEFNSLYYCILALVFPYFISASQQIANTSIIVLNKVKYHALINLFTAVINIVVSYFVAQKFGVIGVCGTTGIVFLLRIVALNIVYKKVLKIDIWAFFKECQIKMFPGICLSAILAFAMVALFTKVINHGGWLLFGMKAICISITYFVVMWLVTWNDYEKGILKSFAGKLIK